MEGTKDFVIKLKKAMEEIKDTQQEKIKIASKMMGECMMEEGLVQVFGLGHAREFSMELGYRAGGLMPFHQFNAKDLALRGKISAQQLQDEDFSKNCERATQLWNLSNIHPKDLFIIVSFSGAEAVAIEMAMKAKEEGHTVIGVVSKACSENSDSQHPSQKKLEEVVDLTLDTCAPYPDLVVNLDGLHANQIATLCGNVVAQMLTAETYRYLKESGKECPVLLSANIEGADVHNRSLSSKYEGRWNS